MSACRSCQRPVTWAIVKKSGKRMPLDPDPVDGGNVEIVGSQPSEHGPSPVVIVHAKDDLPLPGTGAKRFKSHFATCPNSNLHRRR